MSANKTSLLLILLVCAASALQPLSPRRAGVAGRAPASEAQPLEMESLEEVEAALLRAGSHWRLPRGRALALRQAELALLALRVVPRPPAAPAGVGEHHRLAQLPRLQPPPDEAVA